MSDRKNGIFIVVDGIDGAGKTTQVNLLADAFRRANETVTTSKEPTDGQWGRLLRESAQSGRMSLSEELHAFVSDRKEHIEQVILPSLSRGEIVILDRYFYSTIAYQGARGADSVVLEKEMKGFAPEPDIAFFIDVCPSVALERISASRGDVPNQFERRENLEAVRSIFLEVAKRNSLIEVIDGHAKIPKVFGEIGRLLLGSVLKYKRCAKSYDCDVFYCAYRLAGVCAWANLYAVMNEHLVSSDNSASAKT